MARRLERKNAIGTVAEAIEWLGRNPILLGAFLLVGVLEALAEVAFPFGASAFVAVFVADALAHRYGLAEVERRSTAVLTELRAVLPKLLSILGALILYVVIVLAGLLALIIPGIYFALRLSLAFPAIVIDDQSAVDGLETSWTVAHGNLFKLLGISLAVAIAAGLFEFAVALTGAPEATTDVLGIVITAASAAVVQLAIARVYLENRPGDEGAMADVGPWGADSTRRSTLEDQADEVPRTESPESDDDEPTWRRDRSRRDDSNRWR